MTDVLTICYLTVSNLCWYKDKYSSMSLKVSRSGIAWLLITRPGFFVAALPLCTPTWNTCPFCGAFTLHLVLLIEHLLQIKRQ